MDGLSNNSETISSSAHILSLLSRVMHSRNSMQLFIEDLDPFNSTLLAINENGLVLDDLKPEEGNGLMSKGRKLKVSTKLQGIEICFHSEVIELLDNNSYKLLFPKEMDYLQRRAHHRVYFSSKHKPVVSLATPNNGKLTGVADNISLGGIRLVLECKDYLYFEEGQFLDQCNVQLGPSIHIISKIEVRDCQYNHEFAKLSIGAQFLNLSKSQENSLSRYIASIEREMRRR